MIKKVFSVFALSLCLSSLSFASDQSTMTILNYAKNPIEIRVYDKDFIQITEAQLAVNEKAKGHWFTPVTYGADVFDSVHVFALDKTNMTMVHCGDIAGGEQIPLFTSVDKVYEIDDCYLGSQGPVLKWHQV